MGGLEEIQAENERAAERQAARTAAAGKHPERRGWAWPVNAKKPHYFEGAVSLCRRWLFFGELQDDGNDDSPDSCKKCRGMLAQRVQKEAGR